MEEKKITIVKEMVENGYHLFGESIESFANRCTLEMLENGLKSFLNYIGK